MKVLVAIFMLLAVSPAPAANDPAKTCFAPGKARPADVVRACTEILQRPLLLPEQKIVAQTNRGIAHYLQRQFEPAVKDFSDALRSERRSVKLWSMRSGAYFAWGDLNRAQQDLNAALLIAPDDPRLLNNSCWLHAAKHEYPAAIMDCNKSLSAFPRFANALDSRGFVQFQLGHYPEALKDINAALAINPRQASPLYIRGIIKRKTGDLAGGNADIRLAGTIDPEIAKSFAHFELGQAN